MRRGGKEGVRKGVINIKDVLKISKHISFIGTTLLRGLCSSKKP